MTIRGRLTRLKQLHRTRCASEHAKFAEIFMGEGADLHRWLEERGLTAREALATGLIGPPGMRYMTMKLLAEAQQSNAERRQKDGSPSVAPCAAVPDTVES